jgi:UDP-N-acetylglucosamine--N-acetylmuramyl-(pentapeptide) pyrophosphoryl-undecaprenol N-acetylglucosamine transferase
MTMATPDDRAFAVVTGGGTAGHVLPALAVAEALVARGHAPSSIHYVGAARGIETRLLVGTPYPHTFLDVVGLQRRITRGNLGFLPRMWRARRQAIDLLRALRPRVVVSVGGYASVPAVLAAHRLHVPVVVVSYDRFPGLASRFAARRAAASAVAFADSPLPRATVTGAPVRAAVLAVHRARDGAAARATLGVAPERFFVAVTGGSQGSGVLNAAIRAYVDDHVADGGLALRHVVGERFVGELAGAARDGSAGVQYQVVGYEADVAALYAAADLFVGRGGASTVHEVAVTGVPAVLVPWAGAAEDHQTANVRWLVDARAADLLAEADVDDPVRGLAAHIEHWRGDPAGREAMGAHAHDLGEVHRRGALAQLVEDVALA